MEAVKMAVPTVAMKEEPTELADDLSAFAEAVSFLAVLMTLVEAEEDEEALEEGAPVGALLPIMGAGELDDEGLPEASIELGVTKGVAVPDPPVIEK
jgi:hypothetical protein